MTLIAIEWDDSAGPRGGGAVRLLDQTLLPDRTAYRVLDRTDDLVTAIAELAVRGAPALGVAGAVGVVLAMDEGARQGWDEATVQQAVDRVRHARPTAVNLAWGVDQVRPLMGEGRDAVLAAARRLAREDEAANRELSRLGADWLLARIERPRLRVLTHCNTGALATSAWGTALGVVRELHTRGRLELVYADETRPLLQGSRLTAFELAAEDIPHVVQVDAAAASTVLRGLVDLAVVGADRIAANGDAANKIGTLGVALACRDAGIPFMVAAPWSTVDLSMADGSGIEIEERAGEEVLEVGGVRLAPAGTSGFNPAFDVTPARLVDAVATERGVAEPRRGTELGVLAARASGTEAPRGGTRGVDQPSEV
jgi:methylthioribose-1-phosphate isomerase